MDYPHSQLNFFHSFFPAKFYSDNQHWCCQMSSTSTEPRKHSLENQAIIMILCDAWLSIKPNLWFPVLGCHHRRFSPMRLDRCQFFPLDDSQLSRTKRHACKCSVDICLCYAQGNQFNTMYVSELSTSWLWVRGPKVHFVSLKCVCMFMYLHQYEIGIAATCRRPFLSSLQSLLLVFIRICHFEKESKGCSVYG